MEQQVRGVEGDESMRRKFEAMCRDAQNSICKAIEEVSPWARACTRLYAPPTDVLEHTHSQTGEPLPLPPRKRLAALGVTYSTIFSNWCGCHRGRGATVAVAAVGVAVP